MQTIICDRCKKIMEEHEIDEIKKTNDIAIIVKPHKGLDMAKFLDLCTQCRYDLKKWLKGESNAENLTR